MPRLNDLKYFEKPPLQCWATATAYTLLGASMDGTVVVSVVSLFIGASQIST